MYSLLVTSIVRVHIDTISIPRPPPSPSPTLKENGAQKVSVVEASHLSMPSRWFSLRGHTCVEPLPKVTLKAGWDRLGARSSSHYGRRVCRLAAAAAVERASEQWPAGYTDRKHGNRQDRGPTIAVPESNAPARCSLRGPPSSHRNQGHRIVVVDAFASQADAPFGGRRPEFRGPTPPPSWPALPACLPACPASSHPSSLQHTYPPGQQPTDVGEPFLNVVHLSRFCFFSPRARLVIDRITCRYVCGAVPY